MAKSTKLLIVENIFFSIFSGYYMLHRVRVILLCNSMTSDHAGPHASDFCAGCSCVEIPSSPLVCIYYLLHLFIQCIL